MAPPAHWLPQAKGFPFTRLTPVAESLDREGQGIAVALVFVNLVDLELVPRPDRLARGAVVRARCSALRRFQALSWVAFRRRAA
jgi:hypothetical protein